MDAVRRHFTPRLSAVVNRKGVLDVDTVKGCTLGMEAHPAGGCYGLCYAAKMARARGFDFGHSVSRLPVDRAAIERKVRAHPADWFRVGVMGDPCHDWALTLDVCEWLGKFKRPVVVTKHWMPLCQEEVARLASCGAVVNTSISALDSIDERSYRLEQFKLLAGAGVRSVLRVVSVRCGDTEQGRAWREVQDGLLGLAPVIDNPLRVPRSDPRVRRGDILAETHSDLGGRSSVSVHSRKAYVGPCEACPDQCGVDGKAKGAKMGLVQAPLFEDKVEFVHVKSVIGSGYEAAVAKLAIEDGIACRAARKNMQIHSAIILLLNGEFAGFFTFQVNDVCCEFCLLQSVIRPDSYTPDLYRRMVLEVVAKNVNNYPALITTDPKSKFETPALFESVGFATYLKMSGFHYMVKGLLSDVRMKILAHITMTNVWNSIRGDWLRLKKEWKAKIDVAGEAAGVANPSFATREGCWQGAQGMANVVKTKRVVSEGAVIVASSEGHNGNASVLDPTACEVILRFFMPTAGRRVYNPFGGGVQFGFVAGSYEYEYLASEIRQNQCDANNKICGAFPGVKWVRGDSSTYEPEGMFDLVFTCPPYYKVEHYTDYDGKPPEGEINALDTYEKFRDVLFAGYRKAIAHLNENCFFVVMTGDSRDKRGAWRCSEAETQLFFRDNGLSIYNNIVYLECEFTRLAHAKKTLNMRKFPKREQKIIVAYKGDIAKIKDLFPGVGRL
jgi:hypothetical protein